MGPKLFEMAPKRASSSIWRHWARNGPKLSWVEIGKSDLSNVEVTEGLEAGDIVYILPSKGLLDYQEQFRKRVEESISLG